MRDAKAAAKLRELKLYEAREWITDAIVQMRRVESEGVGATTGALEAIQNARSALDTAEHRVRRLHSTFMPHLDQQKPVIELPHLQQQDAEPR